MNITPDRQKKVIFTDVYYATPPVFMGPAADKSDDVSPAVLKGKAVGSQSSTTFANYLQKNYPESNIKLYPGADEPNLDLANGRLDFVVTEAISDHV